MIPAGMVCFQGRDFDLVTGEPIVKMDDETKAALGRVLAVESGFFKYEPGKKQPSYSPKDVMRIQEWAELRLMEMQPTPLAAG